jgi:hypothetical protein
VRSAQDLASADEGRSTPRAWHDVFPHAEGVQRPKEFCNLEEQERTDGLPPLMLVLTSESQLDEPRHCRFPASGCLQLLRAQAVTRRIGAPASAVERENDER